MSLTSRFIDADRKAESLSDTEAEAFYRLSDPDSLTQVLSDDESLRSMVCECLSWGTDRLLGTEMRSKHMLRLADDIERHVRLKAEREFDARLQDALEDALPVDAPLGRMV